MRVLGRASAKARRGPKPERVHESLRSYLKCEVAPAEVWAALKLAMEGQNESARVSASRVLMDALAEEHNFEERNYRAQIAAEMKAQTEETRAKVDQLLLSAICNVLDGRPENGLEHHLVE
jgi:hypothetical protein